MNWAIHLNEFQKLSRTNESMTIKTLNTFVDVVVQLILNTSKIQIRIWLGHVLKCADRLFTIVLLAISNFNIIGEHGCKSSNSSLFWTLTVYTGKAVVNPLIYKRYELTCVVEIIPKL